MSAPFPGLSKERVQHLIRRAVDALPTTLPWSSIEDVPATFPPSAHTHAAADISSGTIAIDRLPVEQGVGTVALGNHLHTGVYATQDAVDAKQDKPIVKSAARIGVFTMTGYDVGLGTSLASNATVITTADGYDPARAYWVEMAGEIFVTTNAGTTVYASMRRHDEGDLGIKGFRASTILYTAEQSIGAVHAFRLPAGGLPGGNGVAANRLEVRMQLRWQGTAAPTGRDGVTFVRMTPL